MSTSQDEAATRIQRVFQGFRVRLDAVQKNAQLTTRRREVQRLADRTEAATVIQARARGMYRRRRMLKSVTAAAVRTRPVGVKQQTDLKEDELREEFRRFDVDGNGFITKEEFAVMYRGLETFGVQEAPDAIYTLMGRYNMLGDDRLSFDEFAILMLKISKR